MSIFMRVIKSGTFVLNNTKKSLKYKNAQGHILLSVRVIK